MFSGISTEAIILNDLNLGSVHGFNGSLSHSYCSQIYPYLNEFIGQMQLLKFVASFHFFSSSVHRFAVRQRPLRWPIN